MGNNLSALPKWVRTNKLWKAKLKPGLGKNSFDPSWDDERVISTEAEANLISSEAFTIGNDVFHFPMIDLDLPARIVPSSTPGHGHLYINKVLNHKQYGRLLTALEEAGIIEHGIVQQFQKHGCTTLRMPHIKKVPDNQVQATVDAYGNPVESGKEEW